MTGLRSGSPPTHPAGLRFGADEAGFRQKELRLNKSRNKLNIMKARRRVRLRSALLLSVLACAVSLLFGQAMRLSGAALAPFARLALETMVTMIAFGMTAFLGLCVLDGDQRKILPLYQLTRGQIFWLALLGVLLCAPMTLAGDMLTALFAPPEAVGKGQSMGNALFLLMLLKSALLVPVCEELFFRGYLQSALSRISGVKAVLLAALVFALAHGLSVYAFLPRLALGLLLGMLMERTGTLLAPVLVHGCYNAAIVIIAYSGLAPLFSGLSLLSCVLRLALSLLCLYALRRSYTARGLKKPLQPLETLRFTRREAALIALAAILVILAEVLA